MLRLFRPQYVDKYNKMYHCIILPFRHIYGGTINAVFNPTHSYTRIAEENPINRQCSDKPPSA